ncbi:hypothetical protein D187_003455 [Cystobacter fuscus DSM 2262]|uniref:Uncharacterized protein n=1 Tax=Cystobacter fuscus (strain ATCC 25194 / DSM 2262 / NBRC 100088 / M29) TaxID=1242864 RepID=S9QR42_CYSF2|nr:hypothetical protein D187_003455 [Cystobacter fuscus DSM 2262]
MLDSAFNDSQARHQAPRRTASFSTEDFTRGARLKPYTDTARGLPSALADGPGA